MQADIAAWGAKAEGLRAECESRGIACVTIEDGFVRSAGLGAAFTTPLSLVFDKSGIYYDPRLPSDIENLLAQASFTEAQLARARALRERIAALGISKYNLQAAAALADLPRDREIILVPGQVADDAAIRAGGEENGNRNVNEVLLAAVRKRNPGAYVIFKPHPDVERVGRTGALTAEQEQAYADRVIRGASLHSLFPSIDRIETYASLAGFEALLRNIPVTVHGMPFYAGWGLTEDLAPIARRGRIRSLDELVAAALIAYARYWDPVSGRACPPETAIERIVAWRSRPATLASRLGLMAGRAVILMRRR
jgi:capsular polysaccharide export protein